MVLCSWLPVCPSKGPEAVTLKECPTGLSLCVPQQWCLTVTECKVAWQATDLRRYQRTGLDSERFRALVCEPRSRCGANVDVPGGCS